MMAGVQPMSGGRNRRVSPLSHGASIPTIRYPLQAAPCCELLRGYWLFRPDCGGTFFERLGLNRFPEVT
jgi:hypothetical protein